MIAIKYNFHSSLFGYVSDKTIKEPYDDTTATFTHTHMLIKVL